MELWTHTPVHTPQVVEGYEVVKAMEACGARSGATAFEVSVADCGPLPAGERREG